MKLFNFFKKKKTTKRKIQKPSNSSSLNISNDDYKEDLKNNFIISNSYNINQDSSLDNTVLDNWYLYENSNDNNYTHNSQDNCSCNDYDNHNSFNNYSNCNDYDNCYDDNNYDNYDSYDSYDSCNNDYNDYNY